MRSVTSIGSCRVATPLTLMQKRYRFAINNRCTYGFVHTSSEILQQLLWMRGAFDIPPEIWPFVSNKPLGEPVPETYAPDAVVVEISSIKKIVHGEFILQLNRIYEVFADVPDLLAVWRKYGAAALLDRRIKALEVLDAYRTLDDERRAILTRSTIELQSVESIQADLARLVRLLPRETLYVTHCDADGEDGTPVPARVEAIRRVTIALEAEGLPWFDPSAELKTYGQADGFSQNGRDTNHYTDGFSAIIGARLCERLWPRAGRPSGGHVGELARAG